jgi:hypothetical protein
MFDYRPGVEEMCWSIFSYDGLPSVFKYLDLIERLDRDPSYVEKRQIRTTRSADGIRNSQQ